MIYNINMNLWIIIGIVVVVVLAMSALLSIASFSNDKFLDIYKECQKMQVSSDVNIQDFLHNINFKYFKNKIKIVQTDKDVENFYNSKQKLVALSHNTLTSNTIASFSIVAHEMGHALQDLQGKKLKRLNILRRIGMFFGFLFLPSLICGIVLFFFFESYVLIGIILLICSATLFFLSITTKIITISIEKDASKKE